MARFGDSAEMRGRGFEISFGINRAELRDERWFHLSVILATRKASGMLTIYRLYERDMVDGVGDGVGRVRERRASGLISGVSA